MWGGAVVEPSRGYKLREPSKWKRSLIVFSLVPTSSTAAKLQVVDTAAAAVRYMRRNCTMELPSNGILLRCTREHVRVQASVSGLIGHQCHGTVRGRFHRNFPREHHGAIPGRWSPY